MNVNYVSQILLPGYSEHLSKVKTKSLSLLQTQKPPMFEERRPGVVVVIVAVVDAADGKIAALIE